MIRGIAQSGRAKVWRKPLSVLTLLSVIFLSSCAKSKFKAHNIQGFESYVYEFQQEAIKRSIQIQTFDLVVEFSNLMPNKVGLCTTWGDNLLPPKVTIDQTFWNQSSEQIRTSVLFHELGHCLLKRVHRLDLRSDDTPISIMYPVTFYINDSDWPSYLDELFSRQNEY